MEATKKLTGKSVKKWLGNNAIIVLMLAVSLIVGIIHPNFFAVANLINLFKNVSIRYIIALGISGCLITTGNDLSAGRLAGFAACLACIFAQTEGAAGKFYPNMPTLPTPVVFILVIAICAIVGLCNGLVVSYLKVQPFIATLGMQQVVYGICLVYTGGTPIGSLNKDFTSLASNTIIGVPVLIWIALIVAACFWFLYNKTRHGKYMYAIGGNEIAAEVSGVNTKKAKMLPLRSPASMSPPPRSASISSLPACSVWQAACWLPSPAAHPLTPRRAMSWTLSQLLPSAAFPPPAVSAPSPAFWSAFWSLS